MDERHAEAMERIDTAHLRVLDKVAVLERDLRAAIARVADTPRSAPQAAAPLTCAGGRIAVTREVVPRHSIGTSDR